MGWLWVPMKIPILTLPPLAAGARRANASGTNLLTLGLSVGAVGLAGAALGAVCPLCVVATPALLGLGVVQKLRAFYLSRRAPSAADAHPGVEPAVLAGTGDATTASTA